MSLVQRLEILPRLGQIAFAFRSASRILPLFACRGHVDFWDYQSRHYLRWNFEGLKLIEYIIANGGTLTSDQEKIAQSIGDIVYESYAKAIAAFNSGRREAGRVADAADVVYGAIYTTACDENHNRHIAAMNTARNSFQVPLVPGPEFATSVESEVLADLDRLEALGDNANEMGIIGDVAAAPLWHGDRPTELPELESALKTLLSEHSLLGCLEVYTRRLEGQALAESRFDFNAPKSYQTNTARQSRNQMSP